MRLPLHTDPDVAAAVRRRLLDPEACVLTARYGWAVDEAGELVPVLVSMVRTSDDDYLQVVLEREALRGALIS